ncbi:substrate-binding periplasmic protein [Burkholderiaceae bacterium UC74_6]
MRFTWAFALTLLLPWLLLAAPAHATGCSRPIQAPMAPTGRLVIVDAATEQVEGVWPEFLRQVGAMVGCKFEFPVMPRPRLENELISGKALDLMISATRTDARDEAGEFVLLFRQPMVILTRVDDAGRYSSIAALRKSSWRMVVPRAFAFNAEYRAFVADMQAEKRADSANDLDGVGRMLRGGRVEFALLSPPQAYATAGSDLSFRRVEDLPLMEVGLYLSKRMLAPADLALLREALSRAAREGAVRRAFLKYYPAALADLNQP